MVGLGNNVSRNDVQRLECKRRYEACFIIKQSDEQARAVRENDYLEKFIKEYESLTYIQGIMRRQVDQIWIEGPAESRRKQTYDVVYRIEVEKKRGAYVGLLKYKRYVEHVRLEVQTQYL